MIALYETEAIEDDIKAGLIGESVEAHLVIRQPVPGTSIEPDRFDLVLSKIGPGPSEDSVLGEGFDDLDADSADEY